MIRVPDCRIRAVDAAGDRGQHLALSGTRGVSRNAKGVTDQRDTDSGTAERENVPALDEGATVVRDPYWDKESEVEAAPCRGNDFET
ncbi:hypothetical protein [Nocardia vaccinii]|uniref:hypothetical protein n=1 Tax=Nocardia vaccinii TaxID=1822 RepID=UPI00082DAEEF|nr:hypothetical protein [Nocardia vaccinii]